MSDVSRTPLLDRIQVPADLRQLEKADLRRVSSRTVADARFAKPLDTELSRRLVRNHAMLVTVEEGAVGGFGSQVLRYLANEGLLRPGLEVRTLTLPDLFQEHDDPARQYETAGLAAGDIARVIAAHFVKKASARG